MLTNEEKTRFHFFPEPLTEEKIKIIKDWCLHNTFRFALVDEDYIFFSLKIDYDKFIKFWYPDILSTLDRDPYINLECCPATA